MNLDKNEPSGMSVDYISKANEMFEIFKNTIFQLTDF